MQFSITEILIKAGRCLIVFIPEMAILDSLNPYFFGITLCVFSIKFTPADICVAAEQQLSISKLTTNGCLFFNFFNGKVSLGNLNNSFQTFGDTTVSVQQKVCHTVSRYLLNL